VEETVFSGRKQQHNREAKTGETTMTLSWTLLVPHSAPTADTPKVGKAHNKDR
jgi:hypothetical protein